MLPAESISDKYSEKERNFADGSQYSSLHVLVYRSDLRQLRLSTSSELKKESAAESSVVRHRCFTQRTCVYVFPLAAPHGGSGSASERPAGLSAGLQALVQLIDASRGV